MRTKRHIVVVAGLTLSVMSATGVVTVAGEPADEVCFR